MYSIRYIPINLIIFYFQINIQLHKKYTNNPSNIQLYINIYKQEIKQQKQMSTYSNQQDEYIINEVPNFQFQLHDEKLINCIKQLTFNLKTQQKTINKLKKDIQARTTQSQITQALVFTNSLIQIDPNLSKQLKSKQNKKDLAHNPINNSSADLGIKINQISQSVSILYNNFKTLDKKVNQIQYNLKASINEKTNTLQQQIDQNYSKTNVQINQLRQKIQLLNAGFTDKVRQVQTKTLWQINDCKLRLNSCVNQQFVRDCMNQVLSKTSTKIKQQLIKQGSIQPQRINKIQQAISKNQKQFANQITQTNHKIQVQRDYIEQALLHKKQYGEDKIQLEKRFGLLNNNLSDVVRRVRQTQADVIQEKQKVKKIQSSLQNSIKQINRMNSVLNNLKIGDDFQRMLQKMDPHKICELDNRIHVIELDQQKLKKLNDLTKAQVQRLRAKTQFVNLLTPNTGGPGTKFNKQQIQAIVHDYFTANLFAKKLQNLESQFVQMKGFSDMINVINKNIAKMQKQTDTHNIIYQLRGLQEYVKKQILILTNRVNSLQLLINDMKSKRPQSASKANLNDQKLSCSISYKKLTPTADCISCYPSPMNNGLGNSGLGNSALNLRKSLIKKY